MKKNINYRKKGVGSTGTTLSRIWYRAGIRYASIGSNYDYKNYIYFYDNQKHDDYYEKKGYYMFEKAASCFKRSAELGNDLATVNYAVYLYAFKKDYTTALQLFLQASDLGLAIADYQLWLFYKNGECGVDKNEAKAEFYYKQYKSRCDADERQLALSCDLDAENERIIGRSYMYCWFKGLPGPEGIYDTPSAKPSSWKYC